MLNPPIRFILVRETNMIFTCRVCESLTKSLWTCSLTSSSVCSLCALSFSSNTWLSRAVCKNPNAHPVGQKSVVTGVRASSFHWRVLCGFWTPSAIGFDIAQFQGVRFIWLGSPIQSPPADFFSSVPTVSSVDEMRLLMVYSTTFLEKSVQFREITANVLFGSQKTRLSVLSRTKRSDSLKRAEVPNGILANRLVARASGSGNF